MLSANAPIPHVARTADFGIEPGASNPPSPPALGSKTRYCASHCKPQILKSQPCAVGLMVSSPKYDTS